MRHLDRWHFFLVKYNECGMHKNNYYKDVLANLAIQGEHKDLFPPDSPHDKQNRNGSSDLSNSSMNPSGFL